VVQKGELVRSEVLKVRVTPAEKERMLEAASRANRTLSDWARLLLVGEVVFDTHAERRTEGEGTLGGGEPGVTAASPPRAAQAAASTHSDRASSSPPSGKGSGEAGAVTPSAVAEPSAATRVSSPGKCPMQVPVGVKCKVCGKVHQPKGRAA